MTRQIEERVGEVQRTLRVLASCTGPVSKPILEEAMTEAADLLDELLRLMRG